MALAGALALVPLPLSGARQGFPALDVLPAGGPLPAVAPPSYPLGEPPEPIPDRPLAKPVQAPTPELLSGYEWPLPNGRLTQAFGPTDESSRVVEGRPFHDGIDLATFCGDRIRAAHDGLVLAAGRRFDREIGYVGDLDRYFERIERRKLWASLPIVVVIDDGNGYRSLYAHLSKVVVKRGQFVRAGQLLGSEGATGNASGCHLHYGLFSPLETAMFEVRPDVARRWKLPRYEIARIDPLLVLPERPRKARPSVLRPPPS
jgi:murein DD-endopeptidase MepM/ murein hydrolase activator NlpD